MVEGWDGAVVGGGVGVCFLWGGEGWDGAVCGGLGVFLGGKGKGGGGNEIRIDKIDIYSHTSTPTFHTQTPPTHTHFILFVAPLCVLLYTRNSPRDPPTHPPTHQPTDT